jgi:hypothetical protein
LASERTGFLRTRLSDLFVEFVELTAPSEDRAVLTVEVVTAAAAPFSHHDHLDAGDRLVVTILGDHRNSLDHCGGCHQGVEHRDPPLARTQVGHDPGKGAGDLGTDRQEIPGGLNCSEGWRANDIADLETYFEMGREVGAPVVPAPASRWWRRLIRKFGRHQR